MEFSSAIYRGDPCPEFSFSFKYGKNCNCLPFYICLCIIIAAFIPPPKRDGGDSAYFMIKCWTPEKNKRKNKRGGVS